MFQSHELRLGSNLANKESLERTRGIVPSHSFSVSVPQFKAMLLLSIFILEIIWFSGVPVLVGDGLARGHPEELSLLGLVGAAGPEVLVTHPITLDVFFKVFLFRGRIDTGQMHPVEPTVLLRFVPVGLEKNAEVVFFLS